jgi:hypothetical protein
MVQLQISGTKQGFTVDVGEDATVVDVKFAVFKKNKKVIFSGRTLVFPFFHPEGYVLTSIISFIPPVNALHLLKTRKSACQMIPSLVML